jgi:tyrosyl-tRNA synthetase
MFGKLMSVSDVLMWRYLELLSFRSAGEVARLRREVDEGRNPRDVKVLLAQEIVERFHSRQASEAALADFEARFRQHAIPPDLPEVRLDAGGGMPISLVLKQSGLTSSTSEALRMIDQGGVRLNGEKVSDRALSLSAGQTIVLQVGRRRFARVRLS